jgi:FKBP-type peptidyl-prolyl cis-trans isomerase SlpA
MAGDSASGSDRGRWFRRRSRGRSASGQPRTVTRGALATMTFPCLVFAMGQIEVGSHVTLHYRLATVVGGEEREVISTLGARPATLQVGAGQLAAPLEARLVGLAEGSAASFDLVASDAFGERNSELVQSLSRAAFDAHADPDADYVVGDVVEFNAPDGRRLAGVLKQRDDRQMVVDFNHPLAGLPLRFSVQVIGVL